MNAPADSPERIAEILREILALSGNEEDSAASRVEQRRDPQLKGQEPDSRVENPNLDDALNG
jgi:hypothetical protein